MYETAEGGNQWSGPDAIAEHVTNKGTYCFINKENAEKHLDGFIKSRPDTEEWIEYECKLPVVMERRFVVDDACYNRKEYRAYIIEIEGIPSSFNDGSVNVEIKLNKQ